MQAFSSDTAKITDLKRDAIIEPMSSSKLTTDHGVLVSDTDNWFGSLHAFLEKALLMCIQA